MWLLLDPDQNAADLQELKPNLVIELHQIETSATIAIVKARYVKYVLIGKPDRHSATIAGLLVHWVQFYLIFILINRTLLCYLRFVVSLLVFVVSFLNSSSCTCFSPPWS